MEKTATLNLRVSPALKQDSESVLRRLGIPMSTAVDMFLNQIVLVGGIPDKEYVMQPLKWRALAKEDGKALLMTLTPPPA